MAIYHLSVKTISRSDGRSATAAAAYRAATTIVDERTTHVHNYSRKRGVVSTHIVLPVDAPLWAHDRARLWNAAEQAETRKNSTVAREFEIALPSELTPLQRQKLATQLAQEIVSRHGCAADVAIHTPSHQGDQRNHHAHILLTTRKLSENGFGAKTRELDDKKLGRELVQYWRERFAQLQNHYLAKSGCSERVDHRSFKEQGLEQVPTTHLGPAAVGYERRTGLPSRRRLDWEAEVNERLLKAKQAGELERKAQQLTQRLVDLSNDLHAALQQRQRLKQQQLQQRMQQGMAAFKAKYQQHQQATAVARKQAQQRHYELLQQRNEQERLRRQQEQVLAQQRAEQARLLTQQQAEERQRQQRFEQQLTQQILRQWQFEREQQQAHLALMAEEASKLATEQPSSAEPSEATPQGTVRREDDGPGWF